MTGPERPRWSTRASARLTAAVLARDFDPTLGYTPCHWCGGPAREADHWPIGRDEGGPDIMANLVPACRSCNAARGLAYVRGKRTRPGRPSREW